MKPEDIIRDFEAKRAERSNLDNHLQECADYTITRKNEITTKYMEGDKRNAPDLFDATAAQALELFAGFLVGNLINPATHWFELTTGDERLDANDRVRRFLDICKERMHVILSNSNFYTEAHELFLDLGWAGTSLMSIEEDDEVTVRFATRHISEWYIDEDHLGRIKTFYRKWDWTISQVVQKYGVHVLPTRLRTLWKKQPETKVALIQRVGPRADKNGKLGSKGFSYESIVMLYEDKTVLEEGGFEEFPAVCPRWLIVSGSKYGQSPTMKALAEIKMVNEMMLTVLDGAQMAVRPPVVLPHDGFMLPLNIIPGGTIFKNSNGTPDDKIETFGNDSRVDFGYQVVEDVRKRIRDCYYVDQFQLAQGPQMTATEVNQRTEEKLKLMGPFLGRFQSEFTRPLIARVLPIMFRKKIIQPDEIPEELMGRQVDVRFSSLVARAQKMSEAANVQRFFSFAAPFFQIKPEVADNIDADAAIRNGANMFGLPQSFLADVADRDAAREAKAQAAAAQAEQQNAMNAASAMGQMGPGINQLAQAAQPAA